jgi:transcriptional regulator with XRE-family HTH domain
LFKSGRQSGHTHVPPVVRLRLRQKNAPVDIARHFGRNLARCRKRVGLSQEELAVRASLHRTAVGQIERGERVARVDTLIKLAGSLSIPPGELLEGMDWDPGGTRIGAFRASDVSGEEPEAKQAA